MAHVCSSSRSEQRSSIDCCEITWSRRRKRSSRRLSSCDRDRLSPSGSNSATPLRASLGWIGYVENDRLLNHTSRAVVQDRAATTRDVVAILKSAIEGEHHVATSRRLVGR